MKKETLVNLMICACCAILSLVVVVYAIYIRSFWNLIPAVMSGIFSYIAYVDDAYGVVSVKSYIKSILSKNN